MFTWFGTWLFNPAMALGTAAVASPIIIHILSRRRFRRVRWAAIEFLLEAHRENRRRVRTEQLLLLLLRCLALLLLAIAFARPFLRPGLASSLLGASARTERIVILDDSYSMMYRPSGGEAVFKDARRAAERLAGWIATESPRDSITLIRTSKPRDTWLAAAAMDAVNYQEVTSTLSLAEPSTRAGGMDEAIAYAAELIASQPTQLNAAVYVVSDFQRKDWTRRETVTGTEINKASPSAASKPTAARSVIAPLADLSTDKERVTLHLLDVSSDAPGNIAITAVTPLSSQLVAGVPGRVAVDIANFTGHDLDDLELDLSVADQALPRIVISHIGAGRTHREPFELTPPKRGGDYVRIALNMTSSGGRIHDGIDLDNTRAWAGRVEDAIHLLLVNGDPSFDSYRDETYLFKTALRPEGTAFSGNEITTVEEAELDGLDFSPFHVIILANVFRLTDTSRAQLERYVRGGGGLIILCGDEIDPAAYNDTLYQGGRGLLPMAMTDVKTAPTSVTDAGFGLTWDESHPVFAPFVGPAANLLRRVSFERCIGVTTEGDLAVATSQPNTTQPDRAPPRILATLDDQDHTPLLVERPYGAGRVMLFTSTIDLDWNNWARDPSYVPFILQLTSYTARRTDSQNTLQPGTTITRTLDPNRSLPHVQISLPGDNDGAPVEIEARQADTGLIAEWPETDRCGVYRLVSTDVSGTTEIDYVAVNPDPSEADLAAISGAELETALPEMSFQYVRDTALLGADQDRTRMEFWWPLLLAAMGLLMIEHVLAWWFGSRGT